MLAGSLSRHHHRDEVAQTMNPMAPAACEFLSESLEKGLALGLSKAGSSQFSYGKTDRLRYISHGVNAGRRVGRRRYLQRAHFIPIVDVGNRGAYQSVHGDLPRQHPFGTTLRFTGPVPADSRQGTPSVRNCLT